MSVSLTHKLRDYVNEKVESGKYHSASEVIRQSLRTMQEQEERERLYWADVRKKVKKARKAIADGDVIDGPAFMRSKIASLKSMHRRQRPSGRSKVRA